MSKRLVLTTIFLITVAGLAAYAGKSVAEKLEIQYVSTLDGWVQRGGQAPSYNTDVLETCEKLVLVSGDLSEALLLPTIQKGEFEFRVNVCAKTTVHRVHHQRELDDQELVREICDDDRIPLLGKLCRRSGLR